MTSAEHGSKHAADDRPPRDLRRFDARQCRQATGHIDTRLPWYFLEYRSDLYLKGHADPVLQGVAAAETIKGIQEQGVIATVKHWLMNEQEMFRMYNPFQPGYSFNVNDRTIHELYMWPFADAIRAGRGSVMSAYNVVNGSAATQTAILSTTCPKTSLDFKVSR